ncbi:hypothetical protein QL285_073093 [Trifolium repens]|nr:hypothetical protein QL285_073093 [Trifolium repens]
MFNRLLEAELSPFVPIVEGVLQALLSEIFSSLNPNSILKPKKKNRHLIRLKSFKGDFTVTTISPQPQEELIPSNRAIYSSKYSRTADVQGLKGIRDIRRAKTIFTYTGQLQILSYQMLMLNLSKTKVVANV